MTAAATDEIAPAGAARSASRGHEQAARDRGDVEHREQGPALASLQPRSTYASGSQALTAVEAAPSSANIVTRIHATPLRTGSGAGRAETAGTAGRLAVSARARAARDLRRPRRTRASAVRQQPAAASGTAAAAASAEPVLMPVDVDAGGEGRPVTEALLDRDGHERARDGDADADGEREQEHGRRHPARDARAIPATPIRATAGRSPCAGRCRRTRTRLAGANRPMQSDRDRAEQPGDGVREVEVGLDLGKERPDPDDLRPQRERDGEQADEQAARPLATSPRSAGRTACRRSGRR